MSTYEKYVWRFTVTVRKIASILTVIALMALVGCSSTPKGKELKSTVKFEILEHKGSVLGQETSPAWVEVYLDTGLEKLADFEDRYCFVGESSGQNLEAVKAWADNFEVATAIAGSVSSRVESTFVGSASGTPEGTYGRYFEEIVKSSAEATYSGARKIDDWWVLARRYDPDDKGKYTDEYRVFILYTIEKDLLDEQVLNMIDAIANDGSATAEQQNAINKVKEILAAEGLK